MRRKRIRNTMVFAIYSLIMVQTALAVDDSSLNGDYITVGYYSDPWSYIASLTFDGRGNVAYSDIATSDNNNESGTKTYSIGTSGRLSLAGNSGVVSPDGVLATWGDMEGIVVGINIAVKKSSGMSTASVNGSYVGIGYYNTPWSNLTDIDFDGNGNVTFADRATSDDNNGVNFTTYSVSSDGSLTINGLRGVVSPDANVIAWVDTDGSNIGLYIAIKNSSGLSNANLNGEYFGVGYYSEPWTNLTSLSFNGNDSMSYDDILTSDNDNQSGTLTYHLDSIGDFSLGAIYGIFSSDVNVGVWVDTSSNIGFYIAIKKSATSSDDADDNDDSDDGGGGGSGGGGGCFIRSLSP